MTNNELIMLQSLPLDIKIAKTKLRIKEWVEEFGLDGVYVSYSGGKDSEVLLDISRSLYPNIKAVFVNTGQEFPETIKQVLMRKKQGYNIDIVSPTMTFREVVDRYGYPVISKEQSQYIYQYRTAKSEKTKHTRLNGNNWGMGKISEKWKYLIEEDFKISDKCCDTLKKKPVKLFEKETGRKPILGNMASESSQRKRIYLSTGCNSFDGKRQKSQPLGFWKDEDIWEYIKEFNLEINEMYTKHNRKRTGCYGCLFGCHIEERETGTNRIVELSKTHPLLYKYLMEKLDYKTIMPILKLKTQLPEENTIFSGTKGIIIQQKSIKIEDILDCLQNKINNCSEPINVAETIREGLYHPNTSKNTISSWYKGKNRDKIEELATKNNFYIKAKTGRGGGFWLLPN